jgi:LemA protein
MKKGWLLGCGGIAAALVVLALAIGGWFMAVNNRLVALQESKNTAWAQVETVLQRRYDLIPNLVATVKGYAEHEKEVLENVTRMRSQWGAARTPEEKAQAANGMESALARLLIVSENYPMLKANENFMALQTQLEGTENRISVERQRYNESVKAYNTQVRRMPDRLAASFLGFEPSEAYFDATAAASEAPKVQF